MGQDMLNQYLILFRLTTITSPFKKVLEFSSLCNLTKSLVFAFAKNYARHFFFYGPSIFLEGHPIMLRNRIDFLSI